MKSIVISLIIVLQIGSTGIFNNVKAGNETIEKKYSITGKIKDAATGEELIGANIFIPEIQSGTNTNIDGSYTLKLQEGSYTVRISYIGYETQVKKIKLNENLVINITLETQKTALKEVVIEGTKQTAFVNNNEMSVVKLKPQQIKAIPALMGEVDVIKAIQLMPGVQSSGEGFSGFNVRGGSSEQNLILLDDAPIYNASHLMGFFSVFNFDAVKDVKLYKGDIPVSNGGRLSSLLDIRQKEGNASRFSGGAGLGTISSRVMIEGPVIKDKCSFLVAARRSYADIFLPMAKDTNIRKNKLYFYDFNVKLNYEMGKKDRISFSGYFGQDVYSFDKAFGMNWGNNTQTLRWNHIYNNRLFSNVSIIRSAYKYEMDLSESLVGFTWLSGIKDLGVKADAGYTLRQGSNIRFGFSSVLHEFQPGKILPFGNESVIEVTMTKRQALEHAVYLGSEQEFSDKFSMEYGIRYSSFQNLGKGLVYQFNDNHKVSDSTVYKSGKIYHTVGGFEPRVSMKYAFSKKSSLKASYSRTRQYIHLASNSQGGTPLDIWFPTSTNVEPQIADQAALGYYRTLEQGNMEFSVEVYYKDLKNQIDFRDNAVLLLNEKLDGELRFGKGRSYGAEFMIRKQEGRVNGWISYTLSKSERKIEEINNSQYYPSNWDKPHNISVVLNYELSKRVNVSANWVYTSGARLTMPSGKFEYGNNTVPVYSGRNGYKLPDYHRLDLSLTLKGKNKPGKKISGEWNFSVYNAYYRKNAFSITFKQDKENPSKMVAYKVYMFPVIPAVTYNVKF
jgi:ribosomal protein L25 (general stress protein Ctc)